MRSHTNNLTHASTRGQTAAGSYRVRPTRSHQPSAISHRGATDEFSPVRYVDATDRLPGIEWVVVAIFVVAMTALWSIQRAEQPQRVVMPTATEIRTGETPVPPEAGLLQVSHVNEYQSPDGFGVNQSHGGDDDPAITAP